MTGALAELFQMLARNEAQMDISSGGGSVAVVTPTRLREALSQANPRAFRVGASWKFLINGKHSASGCMLEDAVPPSRSGNEDPGCDRRLLQRHPGPRH